MSRVVNARKRLERAALALEEATTLGHLVELIAASREFKAAVEARRDRLAPPPIVGVFRAARERLKAAGVTVDARELLSDEEREP